MLQLSFFFQHFRLSSATSSDQDLKGKGYGFGFWDLGFSGLLLGLVRFMLVSGGFQVWLSGIGVATVS